MLLFEIILATCILIFTPPKARNVKIIMDFSVIKPDREFILVIPLVISKKPFTKIVVN